MSEPIWTKDKLPSDPATWPEFSEKPREDVRALRIEGPFTVETCHGPVSINDGYLVINPKIGPWPWAKAIFEASYERVE